MDNYDKKVEKNTKRNEKYINEFEEWLDKKGLVNKTIDKHLSNVDLYLNYYLNYYEINKMEDGCYKIKGFLGDWFIRKCMWSSKSSIVSTAASIKKFYQCMLENNHIAKKRYDSLCMDIKNGMPYWKELVDKYNNNDFYGFF